jgi:hypothetical protein
MVLIAQGLIAGAAITCKQLIKLNQWRGLTVGGKYFLQWQLFNPFRV